MLKKRVEFHSKQKLNVINIYLSEVKLSVLAENGEIFMIFSS